MTGPDLSPEYIPEHICAWATQHRILLERVVREFLDTGTWPDLSQLTRALAAEGQPLALREIFFDMPKPLGWIDHNPERVRLTAFALRLTEAGQPLLEGLVAILRLAVERYPKGADKAMIRQADVADVAHEGLVEALGDVLYSNARFLTGWRGFPEDGWSCPVDDIIVNYWNAETVDDYLEIRADEMRRNPQFGWGTPRVDRRSVDPSDEGVVPAAVPDAPAPPAANVGVARGERTWEIGERIGGGGFGQVCAARSGDTEAVIKLVPKDPGASRELLFADLTGVPNVVPIWDQGEYDGFWFLVMPRADRSLADLLQERGQLSVGDSIATLMDIADALVALDGRVVHRDLKPANVLELDGAWCLADFGIARYAEAATAAETRKGALSAPWAAPERFRGERATAAADIYALGVIGYELLTGELPFPGPDWEDFQKAHLEQEAPDLPDAPAALAALLAECLYKSPSARPSPANLRLRLGRVVQPPNSPGLARLGEVNRSEVHRIAQAGSRQAAAMSAAERQQVLLRDASRAYERISEALFSAVVENASAARPARDPDVRNWRIELASARLEMTAVSRPTEGWNAAGLFDLVAVGAVSLRIPMDQYSFEGRSHALWFADAQVPQEYAWFETGFTLMALMATLPTVDPFALAGGTDAEMALRVGVQTHQVAVPFTPLRLGELEDFVSRWAGWLAEAAAGRLRRLPSNSAQAAGSWRRG